jgi:SulP family sulfate permease
VFKPLKFLLKIYKAFIRYNSLEFFPIIQTLQSYSLRYLKDDIKSGFNVALLAFPQGMAYALIAGLPIHYGIVGSAIATIASSLFAKSNLITFGPTNATAVMLFSAFAALGISENQKFEYLSILVLLVGLFISAGAYFKLAHLVKYISRSVITGYITAAALLIILNQMPEVLGIKIDEKTDSFFHLIWILMANLSSTHLPTFGLSLFTLLCFFLLNTKFKSLPNVAIVLILSSIATHLINGINYDIHLLKAIGSTSWSISLPSLNLQAIETLAGTAIAIALLCIIEGIAIGKSLAVKKGISLDDDQAMYSIGMSNIACAFFSGMPASGSLTRSSLNFNSGSKTVLSNFFCGLIILTTAILLGSFIQYIPVASLAVLVIIVGISLINKHAIRIVTQTTRSDAFVFLITLLSGLYLPLDKAVYFGVGLSIILFLKKVAKTELKEYTFTADGVLAESNDTHGRTTPEISIVHIEGELFFGATDLFREQVQRIYLEPQLKILILKMRNAYNMDASSIMALEELVKHMNENGRYLILSEVRKDLLRVLENSGLSHYIEARNIFMDDPQNPTLSTAKALKRAKDHLGEIEPNISIYFDPEKKTT